MRDILRWVTHWLAAGAALVTAKLDVGVTDSAVNTVTLSDSAVYAVTLSDTTRG